MPGLELLGVEERSDQFVGDGRQRAISRGAGDFDRLAPFGLPLREQGGDECLPLLFGEAQLLVEQDHERVDAGGPLVGAAFLHLGAIAGGLASREVRATASVRRSLRTSHGTAGPLDRFGKASLQVIADLSDLVERRAQTLRTKAISTSSCIRKEPAVCCPSIIWTPAHPRLLAMLSARILARSRARWFCAANNRFASTLTCGSAIRRASCGSADGLVGGGRGTGCLLSRRLDVRGFLRGRGRGGAGGVLLGVERTRRRGEREHQEPGSESPSLPATGSSNPPEKPRRAASRDDSSRC